MWFAASGILVLFLYVNPTFSKDAPSDATIKDAILSLARVIRDNSQRVERHQMRERHLNENLKKSVEDLSKKVSMIDTFVTRFSKIEGQLSKFEQLISQKDERERIQMQKTIWSIEKLEISMEERLGKITNTITEISQSVKPDMTSKLDHAEAHLLEKIARIESRLNSTAIKNEGEAAMQAEKLQTLFTKLDEKERTQNQRTENLIENFENRLKTQLEKIKDTITEVSQRVEPTEPTPTKESISASEIMSKLDETEAHFLEKVARIESRLNRTAIKNDGEAAMQAEKLQALFTKIDEKERAQNRKTESLIENLENHLKTQLENIKATVTEISQNVEPESVSASDIISKLDDTEAHFLEKVARIESRLNTTAIKNEGQAATQAEKLQSLFTKINETERTLNQRTENLIENLENRLRTQLDNIKAKVTEISQDVEPESVSASDIISKLDDAEAHFLEKVARIESRLNTTAVENEGQAATQAEKLQSLFTKIDETERTLNQRTENLVENLENRLRTQLDNIRDQTPITESVSAADIISKIADTEAHFLEKVEWIESTLNTTAVKNEEESVTQAEKLQTLFTKIDDEVGTQNQKTENLIENLENRLRTQLEKIKDTITEVSQRAEPTEPSTTTASVSASDIISKLDATEAHCTENVVRIESRLNSTAVNNEGEAAMQAEKLQTVFTEVQLITNKLGIIENYFESVQEAANKAEEKPKGPIVDIGAICKEQTRALGKVTELVEDTLNRIQVLPTTSGAQLLHNETQAALQEVKHSLQSTVDNGINRVINSVDEHNNETEDSMGKLRSDLATNAEDVHQKLRELESGQKVMISTSDDVMNLKKRLQYGITEITTDIENVMKSHNAANKTLNDKIDKISNDIIDNHSTTLKNLTSKTDEGLKQVWRQIEMLFQKMNTNAETLDNLNQQNEAYVKGTISTMGGIEDKVADIQSRISQVEDNLNYFMQHRSLMTQEFNEIKNSLEQILNDFKASVKEVQGKAQDLSQSGRQPIPPGYESNQKTLGQLDVN